MNERNRPFNTLFMLMSLDGKISTGSNDELDFDSDIPMISGVKDGLWQYYAYEKTTDLYSMNSGRVFAKLGINREQEVEKTAISFIVIDNSYLTQTGVENLIKKSKYLYLITTNKDHPAFSVKASNMTICCYEQKLDFEHLFKKLYNECGIERITVQTGGTLNTQLVRGGFIDEISVFIAPMLVGGKDTTTLLDGLSIKDVSELSQIKALELISVDKLENSYIHLKYRVLN